MLGHRSEFYRAVPEGPFYGFNRPGAEPSEAVIANGVLKTYPGFPHGMLTTHADVLNPDLLAFIKS